MLKRIYGVEAALREFANRTDLNSVNEPTTDGGGIYDAQLLPDEFASRVISDVRDRGDAFVRLLSQALDGEVPANFRVDDNVIAEARNQLASEEVEALELAARRVSDFQSRGLPKSWRDEEAGYGEIVQPIASVGCCIPGGTAPLASTVIMTAVPARVAGVDYVCVVSPPFERGVPHPAVLTSCEIAGVDEVFAIGGAQAVAALTVGTESIPKVDMICGPGSIWVTAAKRQVYGLVGVDGIYGPTETMVIIDDESDPAVSAADLLAQAEHDVLAAPVLVALSGLAVDRVEAELAQQLETLPRAEIAMAAVTGRGRAVVVDTIDEAIRVADAFAPEHLCMAFDGARDAGRRVRNSGGIFVGELSGEIMADYVAGPSHVMPTGGSARFSSALSARDFVKVTPILDLDLDAFESIADAASTLARLESLDAHAHAADIRRKVM